MSYTKHNFVTGGTIHAAPFNAMEDQIAANETRAGTVFSALDTVLEKLAQTAQEVAYTVSGHHGGDLISAIAAARTAIGSTAAQAAVSVTGVAFSPASGSLQAGSSALLTPVFTPSNATNKSGSWTTSDSSVATVSNGNVTALSAGSATITFTSADGGFTASYALTVTAASGTPTYAAQALYTNFTATGARFSTGDVSINFAAGDYVEAVIDASGSEVVSGTNLLGIARNGDNSYLEYSGGEGVLVYKREQNSEMKVLFRVKDAANSVAIDKWVAPADLSNIVVKLDKNGVYLNGTAVSGIAASDLAFLTGESTIAVGARASTLSKATYSSVTVYRVQ